MSRVEKKLNRQIKKYLSSDGDFMDSIESLKLSLENETDFSEKYIKTLNGFPEFFSSIVEVYEQYEDKNKMALRNVEISSQELNESNRKLELYNGSIKAILESLGQALLFFDKQGVCSPIFSKSCLDLLETTPTDKHIWDVLKIEDSKIDSFKKIINLACLNMSAMSFDDIFDMAPDIYPHSEGRLISISYKPIIGHSGQVENILVVAEDKTHERETENLIRDKEVYAEKVIRRLNSKNDYKQVMNNTYDYFLSGDKAGYRDEKSLESLRQNIHTLKGLLGSFSVIEIEKTLHDIEDVIDYDAKDLQSVQNVIQEKVPHIQDYFNNDIKFSKDFLDIDVMDKVITYDISHEKLQKFYDLIPVDASIKKDFFDEFLTTSLFESLKVFDLHIDKLKEDLGKKVNPCIFSGDNILLPTGKYDDLIQSFVHLIRNAVDHGIETPEERAEKGKDEVATIHVHVDMIKDQDNKNCAQILMKDDGQGIDADVIRNLLSKKQINHQDLSDDEVLQFIFSDQLSSKSSVSSVSGRGVGLSAVKNAVEEVGGSISVRSEKDKGTCFTIIFPTP